MDCSPWNSPGQNTRMSSFFPSPGDLPNPGIEPWSPASRAESLPAEPPAKPKHTGEFVWTKFSNISRPGPLFGVLHAGDSFLLTPRPPPIPQPNCLGLVEGEKKRSGHGGQSFLRVSANLPALAPKGLQRPRRVEPGRCHLLRGGPAPAPWPVPVYLRGPGGGGALALWVFSAGGSLAGVGRGGAARASSRGTPTRSGSEAAVLLQRPDGGGGGGDDDDDDGQDCGGDGGGDRRCSLGAAAGSAAARTAAEGPAGPEAEQLRHGERGRWRRRCPGAPSSPLR